MKIQNILIDNLDTIYNKIQEQTLKVLNSATAKIPNAYINKKITPVVYRNGNSVNDQIGLDFSSSDYNMEDSVAKEGTTKNKKKKKVDKL